jgi:hypothetical protein
MNFAQMLAMDVKPQPPTRPPQGKKGEPTRNTATAIEQHTLQTQEAYKAIMEDWAGTKKIQDRLGLAAGSIFATLERYRKAGLVERRPYQNLPYNQRSGWEWRWKSRIVEAIDKELGK